MKIDILGTEYDLLYCRENEMKDSDNCGECNRYTKTIKINKEYFASEDAEYSAILKTERHEIIHAFLHEAGLDCYSEDETLVDALAVLIPKMVSAFEKTMEGDK